MDESTATLEELSSVRKRLQIEVPAPEVQAELERAFQLVGRQAQLRGFRPGKAPRHVLERMFGSDVRREVLGRLVERSLHDAIEAHKLSVVGVPDVDAETLTPGAALRYSATVEVRPTIELGDLGGLQAVRPPTEVADEEVERVLGNLRESVAQLRPIENRATVETGDVVTVDLATRLEGAEPSQRQDVLLEAGSGSFPLALERQLVGQHRGAHLSLRVPYPEDHPNPGLAGKTVEFAVDLKDIRTKELPALDDDFARDHGRCESLADLRARLRADLERQAVARADEAVREAILAQLVERHPFDVPPSLVERRTESLLANLGMRMPEGKERDQALANIRGQLEPRAERQVRAELLLDAVAAREGISVTEDEISAEIESMARDQHLGDKAHALYHHPEAREALRARLARDRALAALLAAARVMPTEASESVAHEK
jgi:trigger factor